MERVEFGVIDAWMRAMEGGAPRLRAAACRIARGLSLFGALVTPGTAAAHRDVAASARDAPLGVERAAFGLPVPRPPVARPPAILLAHAIVVRRSPEQGGVAAENIGKVDVWYDAGIRDAFAALAVISASGQRVDKRNAAIDKADPAHVSVSVDPLAPGKYTVRYRALSADGHLVSGAWDFEVRP